MCLVLPVVTGGVLPTTGAWDLLLPWPALACPALHINAWAIGDNPNGTGQGLPRDLSLDPTLQIWACLRSLQGKVCSLPSQMA